MDTISNYKDRAIASLSGNWGNAAIMVLIYYLLTVALSTVCDYAVTNGVGVVVDLLVLPMAWGVTITFLEVARGMKLDLGNLTVGYKDFTRIFLTMLLKAVYMVLWTLLLVVPGIVKNYSYAMTEFLLRDHPELKYDEAITESMRLMQGHKMQLFLLDLSLIGWFILSCLTCGIGFLFLVPYYEAAHAHFYEDLVKD